MLRRLLPPLVLLIASCVGYAAGGEARSKDVQAVLSKIWQWETTITPVEEIRVSEPERYTILLGDGGKLPDMVS